MGNVEIMVLVEVNGQIGQKANWANCFFQCVQGMLRIISIIYIIINIIIIIYIIIIIFIINLEKEMCIHENAQFAFAQFAHFRGWNEA